MARKALIVVTSTEKYPNLPKATGVWFSEASHFYDELIKAGWTVDFASPRGGYTPIEPMSLGSMSEEDWKYYADPVYRHHLANTKNPSQVNPDDYDCIHFAGGHGTVWDFYEDEKIHEIARKIYEKGGILAAVCHGPVALCNLKLSNGEFLVKGKKLTCFSDIEEKELKLDQVVPFMLETELRQKGAEFSQAGNWEAHVVADGNLITGQNPASTLGVAKAVTAYEWKA